MKATGSVTARSRPVPPRPGRHPRLVAWLVGLVLAPTLPVSVFALSLLVWITAEEQASAERRILASAEALSLAIERELASSLRALQTLARSDLLEQGDLEGFRREAERVRQAEPAWVSVVLLTPEGRHAVDTSRPFGEELGLAHEPESVWAAVAGRRSIVGALHDGYGRWTFPVRVPVVVDGEIRYVLSASVRPEALGRFVERLSLASDAWTQTIVDGNGVIAARTRQPGRWVGQSVTPDFLARIRAASRGIHESSTMEGVAVYVAFVRDDLSGWTSAVAVPKETVDGPPRRTLILVGSAGVTIALVGLLLAGRLARRLSRGLGSAARAAEALPGGAEPAVVTAGVRELEQLEASLRRTAELLDERARERDDHLARAEAARAEAERANRAKDEFLAMLGHELRNPLAPIVTSLRVLELRGHGHTTEHAVIARQVQHLSRLVDDLLDVARMTRGLIVLRREPLELAKVVGRAVEMVRPQIVERGHALTVDVPRRGLGVSADPLRLAQVVSNLLVNASRYTPRGGNIQVRGRLDGDEVVLEVEDDGQGLPPELQARVFDLFIQGPRALERSEGGLGIGLTLVRSLVDLHGGRVDARSEGPGEGSTFTVRLPALPDRTRTDPTLADDLHATTAESLRVVVVDDHQDGAEALAELLRLYGHEVCTAHDGVAGAALITSSRPDVALLDLGLPGLDGFAVAARVQEDLGAAAPVLLALTGYGQDQDRERTRAAGFRRHLVKPADPDDLLAELDVIIEERARRGEVSGS